MLLVGNNLFNDSGTQVILVCVNLIVSSEKEDFRRSFRLPKILGQFHCVAVSTKSERAREN